LRLLDVPPDNIGRWYVGGPLQPDGGLAGNAPQQNVGKDAEVVDGDSP
jgi:cell division protein FtsI (penicillin-binding protein 3)